MNWNDRPYEWVGDWSARRAAMSPDRTALVDATTGTRWTYRDLDRRANRSARLLADRGVTNGERVAVLSRNRVELVDLFFATGKTGGVLAPLSHRLARREVAELLDLVDPRLLVVEAPFAELAGGALSDASVESDVLSIETAGGQTASVGEGEGDADGVGNEGYADGVGDDYTDALPDDDSPVEPAPIALDDPHLLLHTGGSTGTPKETTITHGSICWNSLNTIVSWGLRPDDVTPMVFPMFHTGGWNVLTVPIFHLGGTVVIDREVEPGRVLAQVEEEQATVLVAVPAVLRMMVNHDDWESTDLSSLRFVKSGGGPCRESIIRAWRERDVDLSQGYGLTECGPNNFAMPDDWARGASGDPGRAEADDRRSERSDDWVAEKAASVGKPALHVDARIVDDDGAAVPPGEVGELELAGQHAAAGYWGDEAETEATFGSGWVSTGDLARVDGDGYYHIVGRKKHMFVSGGENVYPPRVEDAIADHPAVDEVVVVGVPDERWGTVGKAVVETAGDESLTLEDLDSFLEDRLARFEVPKHLAFVDEMPTSGPAKIDRAAIEERYGA